MIEARTVPGEFSGRIGGGRCGYIYYREPPKELKIYWESSGSPECDAVLMPDFRCWPETPEQRISEDRQVQLLEALRDWLKSQKIRTNLDPPPRQSDDTTLCLWDGCDRPRLQQCYYCRPHFDLSCLVRDPPLRVRSSNKRLERP